MNADDWRQRWADQQIGFHQPGGHPLLARYWPTLSPELGERVLVPLCGKARDMDWLAARGHGVVGIELAERAARDFFAESDKTPARRQRGAHGLWRAAWPNGGSVAFEVADFFDVAEPVDGRCPLFFDRAALIALPDHRRDAYVDHLAGLVTDNARGLLVTLDYPAGQIDGPPFALSDAEVQKRLAPAFNIECLDEREVTQDYSHLAERGASTLFERVYRLARARPG